MEDMLLHYEYECTFHTVECLRCGEEVLHRELATHYVAGCSAAASSARAGNTSSDSQALTLEGVTVTFENLKALLRDANHEQLLPVIQSEMNELIEQIRDQERRSEVITHAVAAPATSAAAQVAAPSLSTSLQKGTSRQNPAVEASSSSTSRSRSNRKSKRPKVEPLVALPRDVLQAMRKTSSQDYPQHAITNTFPGVQCHLELIGPLSSAVTWREVVGTVKYVLTLANFLPSWPSIEPKFPNITVLHTRDAYFTVEIYCLNRVSCNLFVKTTFHGKRQESGCPPPVFVVKAYNLRTGQIASMWESPEVWECEHDRHSWAHRRHRYGTNISLNNMSSPSDGVMIEIELCRR
ncbi:hypothetical protein MTO96_040730 [Rhipicephalus appendiculatus]